MKKIVWLAALAIAAVSSASAQIPFSAIDSINANKINASVLVHGDMWWDPEKGQGHCRYRNDTPRNVSFAASVWMSGYDAGNQLHVAAQTYRQDGNDYWPGPLDADGSLSYATSYQWAKIWKTTRDEINAHKANLYHTVANTPESILIWPGKNNVFAKGNGGVVLDVPAELAPFVDLNGDGRYQPLKGEYPDIRGDQGLWYVFTDNGPSHSQTSGTPLGVEVRVLAYAYKRGTLIDNVVYYDYTILNKSANDYHGFRFALWDDVGLGYYDDAFVGFDSSRRLGIKYNNRNVDGGISGSPANAYGRNPPVTGVTFIALPGDTGTENVPAGSFMFFRNDPSTQGLPVGDVQFNNYMRSKWRDGTHLTNTFSGKGIPSHGYGSGPECKYAYPGDPADTNVWSECVCNHNSGNQNYVLSSNDFDLKTGDKKRVVIALVITDSAGGCPGMSFGKIKTVADTAWGLFHSPPPPINVDPIQLTETGINVYPNPAHEKLYINWAGVQRADELRIIVSNAMGQKMTEVICKGGLDSPIEIEKFPPGVYVLQYFSAGANGKAIFVKE